MTGGEAANRGKLPDCDVIKVFVDKAATAAHLGFDHPKTGKKLEFSSDLHQDIHHAGHVLGVPPDALSVDPKEDR